MEPTQKRIQWIPASAVTLVIPITAKTEKSKKVKRCVLNVLVTIPACSRERPERHAHRRLQDDGVPVLHVEPIPARLRQLRVVFQELEQDSDEVVTHARRPSIVDTSKKQKRKLGQKG